MTEAQGPDRNRLHDLTRLTWDEARTGDEPVAVTDQQVAEAGPYSVDQIREHLRSEQGTTYTLETAGDSLRVTKVV